MLKVTLVGTLTVCSFAASASAQFHTSANRLSDRAAGLEVGQTLRISDLRLDGDAQVAVDVQRFEILAPGADLVVAGAFGEREMATPSVVLLRGGIPGEPDSQVFLGVSQHGTYGFLRRHDEMHMISTGEFHPDMAQDAALWLSNEADLPPAAFETPDCAVSAEARHLMPFGAPRQPQGGGVAGGDPPCRVARIAIDTDWQFTGNVFGGNTSASADYALTLIAAVGEIYTEELNTRLLVNYLRVWQDSGDPYPDSGDLLTPFQVEWNTNQTNVEREVAHILSGRWNLPYGGVAWVSVVCNSTYGYGVSGYLNGFFPYPLQDNHSNNWDVVVVAHELGHNFGTLHTHDGYNPPIDNCGNGDCADADEGTIMSYCHTCPGGMTNIALTFGPLVIDTMLNYLDTNGCDITAEGAQAVDDLAVTLENAPLTIDVLLNDLAASCDVDAVVIDAFDTVSSEGGTIELVAADETIPRDRLLYTPPDSYTGGDSFTYSILTGDDALVDVDVSDLRQAENPLGLDDGVAVAYYDLVDPTVLPDFDALTPYADEVVSKISYTSTEGTFAGSGLADEVGAVFTGYVDVPEDALYTLFTNSDDGSRLYIGEQLVVDNDGLHGMVERDGGIGLEQGRHATRVEFFERFGGAGLIVSIEGGGLDKQVIPQWMWFYQGLLGDISGDGVVNTTDLLLLLGAWGPCNDCDNCTSDLDENCTVDGNDLILLLGNWG